MKILKPKLTDSEIRLIVLSAYYNALKTSDTPLQGKIPRLEHIDYNILNWHFIWLIEHDFLKGVIDETNAGSIASITRISRDGMDLIEKFSEMETNDSKSELLPKIRDSESIQEKSSLFSELVLEGMKLTNNVLSLANKFLGG